MVQTQVTQIPIVMIIVVAVLGLSILSGALRGFVRKISGIVAFLLAGILVTSLLPPVTSWLHTTPVYGFIKEQCEKIGGNIARNSITGAFNTAAGSESGSGAGDVSSAINAMRSDDGSGTLDRGKIKAQLQAMGYDPSIIDSMSDAELESYAQQLSGSFAGMIGPPFLLSVSSPDFVGTAARETCSVPSDEAEVLPAYSLLSDGAAVWPAYSLLSDGTAAALPADASAGQNPGALLSQLTAGMDRVDQTKFIESLPLPQAIKDQMEAFNNENGYRKLGAADFASYIINYIASLIMNILAYAVTLLVVWLIIRLVLGALSVFRSLPIVGWADHLLGLVLGVIQGILIVWGLFLVLSLFATSQVGAGLMREINASPFLSFLYNSNPFLNSAAGAIRGIM